MMLVINCGAKVTAHEHVDISQWHEPGIAVHEPELCADGVSRASVERSPGHACVQEQASRFFRRSSVSAGERVSVAANAYASRASSRRERSRNISPRAAW